MKSFLACEELFFDSVRMAEAALSADQQAVFAEGLQGFIGQEATHWRIRCLVSTVLG